MVENNPKVAYVCYGSNKDQNRFQEYLDFCEDNRMPSEQYRCLIPYEMYFAGHSYKWNGKSAFIEVVRNSAFATPCRVYIITKEQFEIVKKREGTKYTKKINLGKIKGYEAVTFTSEKCKEEWDNATTISSSKRYMDTIARGEQQCQTLEYVEIEYRKI